MSSGEARTSGESAGRSTDRVTDGGIAAKILANAPGGAVYVDPTDKNAGGFFSVPKVVE